MKFTKHLMPYALCLTAIASLAGCGGQNGDDKSDGSDPVTITFWNNYTVDKDGQRGTSDDADSQAYWHMVDMIAAFEEANPNIKVETKAYKDYNAIATAVDSALGDGNTPSMAITYGTYAYNWKKYLVDVTEKGEAMEKDADILQDYMVAEKQQYGGSAYYTLPFGKSTEALMINRDVFEAVGAKQVGGASGPTSADSKTAYSHPETFADMMEIARKMKADYPDVFANQLDSNDLYTACPLIYETAENLFFTVMESAGIPYAAANDEADKGVLFRNDEAKEAIVQLKKWNNEGLICVKDNLYYSDKDQKYHAYPSSPFADGKCFMIIATTRGSEWMTSNDYAVEYTELPKWDASSTLKVTSQGGSVCFFKKSNKAEQDAAIKFYDFLNGTDNLAKLAATTDYCPIRASSYQSEEIKASVKAYNDGITASSTSDQKKKAYFGNVLALSESYAQKNASFMSPVNKYSSDLRKAVKALIVNVFQDKTAKTDDEIKKLVKDEFDTAYNSVVK